MNFSKYIESWLFDKDGYYCNYKDIGKEGDFWTAVSASMFFGGTVAKKIIDTIEQNILPKDTTIVEIGAHAGYLMADIIQFIYTLKPKLLESLKFVIVEQNKAMLKKQKEYINKCFGDKLNIKFVANIKDIKLPSAFIVANELFDTFICELVWTNKQNKLQKAVAKNHTIKFVDFDKEDKYIKEICDKYNITKGEVSLGFEDFAKTLTRSFGKFEFITFDYGEYYHRQDFSCRIYKQHKVYAIFEEGLDIQKFYKNSDITYDVHFKHLIDSFKSNDIQKIAYKSLLKAMVEFGMIELLEILKNKTDENTYAKHINQVKPILDPAQMGERFKMAHFRFSSK